MRCIAILMASADALEGGTEGVPEEMELKAISDALNAYETICWPEGKAPGRYTARGCGRADEKIIRASPLRSLGTEALLNLLAPEVLAAALVVLLIANIRNAWDLALTLASRRIGSPQ